MNKAVLLGPKGNLGTAISKQLADYKWLDVIELSHNDYDVTNIKQMKQIINATAPNYIINTTAYNALDRCELDDNQFNMALQLNSESVRNLGSLALSNNATLIHFSTECVFPGNGEYQENSETDPINRYGLTKQQGENQLAKLGLDGLNYYLIRLPRLFGTAGKSVNSKPSFFDVILNASKNNDSVKVVCDEYSNFAYTADVASIVKEMMQEKYEYGIYHQANLGLFSWYEAAKIFFKTLNNNVTIIPIEGSQLYRNAPRPKNMNLVNTKLPTQPNFYDALYRHIKNDLST